MCNVSGGVHIANFFPGVNGTADPKDVSVFFYAIALQLP